VRIGGATAHNGPRRTDDPAERVPPAVARRRAEKAAHTAYNVVTRAVFHAPMFALNADACENACAPKPHVVHADGRRSHVSARVCGRPYPTHTHTRARISGPAAHNGLRRIDDPPSASRLWWRAARGRKGGAYPVQRGYTRGVPRADVRVERRRIRQERLRAEATRGPRRRNALACVGTETGAPNRTRTRAHARAHGRSTWPRLCGGPAHPFIGVASRAWI
jgi:hypothetical protein